LLFEENHPFDLNTHRHLLVVDLDQEGVRLQDVFMGRAKMEPMNQGLLDLDAHPDYLSLSASLRYDVELWKVKVAQLPSPPKETV
jgi:hypothetical protein